MQVVLDISFLPAMIVKTLSSSIIWSSPYAHQYCAEPAVHIQPYMVTLMLLAMLEDSFR